MTLAPMFTKIVVSSWSRRRGHAVHVFHRKGIDVHHDGNQPAALTNSVDSLILSFCRNQHDLHFALLVRVLRRRQHVKSRFPSLISNGMYCSAASFTAHPIPHPASAAGDFLHNHRMTGKSTPPLASVSRLFGQQFLDGETTRPSSMTVPSTITSGSSSFTPNFCGMWCPSALLICTELMLLETDVQPQQLTLRENIDKNSRSPKVFQ